MGLQVMAEVVLLCALFVAVIGHGYLWIDAVNVLHAWAGPRKIIDLVTLACLLAFVGLPLLVVWHWRQFEPGLPYALWSQGGLPARYLQLCIVWGTGHLLFKILGRQVDPRRTLLHWRQEPASGSSHLDARLLRGTYPQLLGRIPGNQILRITVDYKQLAISRLHSAHEGLRIAHISDLHMTGRVAREWFERVAQEVNQLQADIVAITGDIVEKRACWPWLTDSLGQLKAPGGVYFILGNHDAYLDVEHTRALLVEAGLICLSGRWLETQCGGAPIVLAGNELPWLADVPRLSEAPSRGADQLPLRLLLTHTPDQFAWACRQDANLVLAGHTHGGQIRLPLLGAVASPSFYSTLYACGVFRSGETVMHVSRGLSGKTPLRWNCPPEIALLELVRGE